MPLYSFPCTRSLAWLAECRALLAAAPNATNTNWLTAQNKLLTAQASARSQTEDFAPLRGGDDVHGEAHRYLGGALLAFPQRRRTHDGKRDLRAQQMVTDTALRRSTTDTCGARVE